MADYTTKHAPKDAGKQVTADQLLLQLFSHSNPAGSEAKLYPILIEWVHRYGFDHYIDPIGNFIVDTCEKPTTIFTAHLDDVSRKHAKRKLVMKNGILSVKGGGVLGADDKAGVWVICQLIKAKIKGRFIFTVGEECGGIGSTSIDPSWLNGIQRAIGFDRKGYTDIITYQAGGRCCSDKFGKALAQAIGGYEICDYGIFTDTDNWTDIIPECTNVSVGYQNAHSTKETLDFWWLSKCLLPRLLTVQWDTLPTVRKVTDKDDWDRYDWPKKGKAKAKVTVTAKAKTTAADPKTLPWKKGVPATGTPSVTAPAKSLKGQTYLMDLHLDPMVEMIDGNPCPWTGATTCSECWHINDCEYGGFDEAFKEVDIDESRILKVGI